MRIPIVFTLHAENMLTERAVKHAWVEAAVSDPD
jgi:hypothetical protein